MPHPETNPDMQLAAAVQEALLTESLPQCKCGQMVLRNRMCRDIGGDFYYFRQLGQDQVALVIGDVVGHGTSAALVMTLIMGVLRADRPDQRRPSRVVEVINESLLRLGDRIGHPITCTLIYGIVDLPSGLLLYVNAGHPHPIICNRLRCAAKELRPTTMMLGVQSGVSHERCHNFVKGDRLILFTDGIVESRDDTDDLFGIERLTETIVSSGCIEPERLAQNVFDQIDRFTRHAPRQDDQTLVIVDFDDIAGSI